MVAIPASSALMTVEEFLEAEKHFDVRHEYLGGMVYAMAGASTPHNEIAVNLIVSLGTRLRGKPCKPFRSDMKVKLNRAGTPYFYYPDAMIVCNRAGLGASWCEQPTVLFEIVSESTRSIDEREKHSAYLSIPGLAAYVLIEQSEQRVVIEHRCEIGWNREVIAGPDAIVKLAAVDVEFPLAELYERVGT
jgi:Uma2 family endonuclease